MFLSPFPPGHFVRQDKEYSIGNVHFQVFLWQKWQLQVFIGVDTSY